MRRVIGLVVLLAALLLSGGAKAQDFIRYYPPGGLATLTGTTTATTSTVPIIFPEGTAAAPSVQWAGGGAHGFHSFGSGNYVGLNWSSATFFEWTPGQFSLKAAPTVGIVFYDDVALRRVATDTLQVLSSDDANLPTAFRTNGGYSSYRQQGVSHELITLSTSGATTDSSANLLPANSVIEAVVARVTTTVTGSGVSSLSIGDPTTAARFATGLTLTAGDTTTGLIHMSGASTTLETGPSQPAAAKIRITAVGGTPSGGVVRVLVYYTTYVVPGT